MSAYGNYQTRSKAGASTRAASRTAGSKAGSRAGDDLAGRGAFEPRGNESYGAEPPAKIATQVRRRKGTQGLVTEFQQVVDTNTAPAGVTAAEPQSAHSSRSASLPPRAFSPNSQLHEPQYRGGNNASRFTRDQTGIDRTGLDRTRQNLPPVDGATMRSHVGFNLNNGQPVEPEEGDVAQVGLDFGNRDNVKQWVIYFLLGLLVIASTSPVLYYGTYLGVKYGIIKGIGGKLQAIVSAHDSLVHRFDTDHQSLVQEINTGDNNLQEQIYRLDQRISEIINDQQITAIETQYGVDWFDPRNDAVTFPPLTSPEKMRTVRGWMGLFRKQVPFK